MSWMYNVTKFDKKFYTRRFYQDMMHQMTYSKFAFLDKTGKIYTVGDFKTVEGLKFSNLNHLPYAERQRYEKSYSYGYSEKPKARIGIFWYTIDPDLLDKEVGAFAKRLEGFLFDIKIGDVDLVASREEISYTKRTIEFLNNMLKSFKQQIVDELKNTVESMSSKDFLKYINKNHAAVNTC